MTNALTRRSLRAALRDTASNGFAHVDGFVEPAFLRALARELDAGPLRRMAGTFGKAGVRKVRNVPDRRAVGPRA